MGKINWFSKEITAN